MQASWVRLGTAMGAAVAVAASVSTWSAVGSAAPTPAPQQVPPVTNPTIPETCGLDAVLVLDASGSIDSSSAVGQVRDAGEAFLDALADTGSTARVLQFATFSEEFAPQTVVTQASVDTGVLRTAIDDYYNPKPPRPNGSSIYSYDGSGNPQSSSNWNSSNNSNQYTNWQQSLAQAGETQTNPIELVVYVTDGDPTAYDFNQPGDPFNSDDVGVNTNRGSADAVTMSRAETAANGIKSGGARILAVGVGSALNNPNSQQRLVDISGPQVVTDDNLSSIESINDVDVALVEDFDDLAQFLRGVVIELCTPSISISKLAQSPLTGEYELAPNWDVTVTPTVAGGFTWTLPDLNPPAAPYACDLTGTASRTCPTNANGVANFQWQPNNPSAQTSALVSEELQPGYVAGNPDDDDFKCRIKDVDGNVDHFDGNFDPQAQTPSFTIPDVDPRAIVTCSLYNSFVFNPSITLDKVDDPRSVRADAEGIAGTPGINQTTSTFTVTNDSTATPLFLVELTDTRCVPERDDATDVNDDDRLDPGESWTYTCTRAPTSSPGSPEITIPNVANVHAVDIVGNPAQAQASDAIEVYAAGIDLVKTASPEQIPVGGPDADRRVTYTYTAVNTGNMPLTGVTVVDTAGPSVCPDPNDATSEMLPASADIAVNAQQVFTCSVTLAPTDPTQTFTNTAVVTGQPQFPDGAATALGPVGMPVTAEASAVVTSYTEGIRLTKDVAPTLIFNDTPVTYTYTVTNTGTVDLENVELLDDLTSIAGVNGSCANIVGPTGDVGGDGILSGNPQGGDGESWGYTCQTTIDIDALDGSDRFVVNVASVTADPVDPPLDPLVDYALAVVEIVTPEITLDKTAVRPVVLDPAAIDLASPPTGGAVDGPDVPTPRVAEYTYLLTNSGTVPVQSPSITDERLDTSTACSPVVPVGTPNDGDVNDDGILDPGEAWQYTCSTPLTKADADGAVGPTDPGVVTNVAQASGTAFIPGADPAQTLPVVSNQPQAEVLVIQPAIELQKTPCVDNGSGSLICDPDPDDDDHLLVRPNTTVTYQYTVTNTGDSDVILQVGLDDLCSDIVYVSGGNGDAALSVGEEYLFECDYEVGTVADSPVVNTAGVAALGPLGNFYVDIDTATVRIFDPAIEVVKSVSDEFVPVGTEVTYTFEVTNTGEYAVELGAPADVQLAPVLLVDVSSPANPACTTPTYVSGDVAPIGVLTVVPAETWVYTCSGTVDETTLDLAAVRGTDIRQGFVYDADVATVTAYEAGIDIVKTADPTQLPFGGGPVTYSYAVTNTGNVPLAAVKVQIDDDTCSPVTYVSGDDDSNDLLTSATDLFETGPDETWIFECTTNITQDTTNVVTVEGTPVHPTDPEGPEPLGPNVTANDTAFVQVLPATTTTTTTTSTPTTSTVAPLPPIPPPTTLPPTGGNSGSTMWLGLLALAAGAALVTITRRRHTT